MAAFSEIIVIPEDMYACVYMELGMARVDDNFFFSIEVDDFWNWSKDDSQLEDLDKILQMMCLCELFIVR